MAEKLGKIEKPDVAQFKEGRKLYFIPLIYTGAGLPQDCLKIFSKYWEQVGKQVRELESKLGQASRIYYELVPAAGEDGSKTIKELDESGYKIIQTCVEKGARLESLEDIDLLTEYMDWGRCLITGPQNEKVFTMIYESYLEVSKKRNEFIAGKIDETLKENETGILLMRENHQVQFPADIQVFYIAPPALDELKRWLREHQESSEKETEKNGA